MWGTVVSAPLAGGMYSLQHTLWNLHMLHGDNLSQLLQTLHIADLIQELHTAVGEERIQRDKEFATRKAERANLRVLLRDKYRLPQSAQDDATVQMAGDDIDVPEELAKMVDEDEEQEENNDSFMAKLQNMDVDFETIKTKAQTTMTEVKQAAEDKCVLM